MIKGHCTKPIKFVNTYLEIGTPTAPPMWSTRLEGGGKLADLVDHLALPQAQVLILQLPEDNYNRIWSDMPNVKYCQNIIRLERTVTFQVTVKLGLTFYTCLSAI